ncbi:mammalian cell entry protein [Mycobacterium spongiae]|uniref:Mammalian cell entry protein n=1 Tax=Mycobacterium spongiae TaxID=886343 RepID=A0A975PVF0_9MYCO|nr:mammalian cell entry protein [Mycobacterium spongiae]QUR65937.1 mammalian cell entry protein [Mycobacterium spongiae]
MSPRRKFAPGEESLLVARPIEPARRWGLTLLLVASAVVASVAISLCAFMLNSHESHVRAEQKNRAMLSDVRSFMTMFTSPDPFHANDYAEAVLSHATGDFAKQYNERVNDILIRISGVEPTTGTVLDAGVERWNDDGSANVLVVTQITSKSSDGEQVVSNANRWLVTARQEGNEWKISSLLPVI